MSSTFWKDTIEFLLTGMGTDLFSKTEQLITQIAPLFSIGFGIYFLMIILDAYNRGFDDNLQNISKRAIGWLIIIACAFNAAQYSKIANIAYNLPEALASVFGNDSYNASALDTAWGGIMQSAETLLAQAAELDFYQLSDKLMLWWGVIIILVLGIIFFGIITSFYIVAKIALAMVIMIGPVFLGCLLFPATRQYGMNWIGQILNYAVTITFYTILSVLQMQFFKTHLEQAITGGVSASNSALGNVAAAASVYQIYGFVPMFLFSTIVFVIVAWNIPAIASALTGGASMSGIGQFMRLVDSASKKIADTGSKKPNKSTGGAISQKK